MQFQKTYTFSWWQMGIIKLALLTIGISIGIYWESFFINYIEYIWGIAGIATTYSLYISIKQL
ncbi:hypothetical protein KBD33_01415 [Candidatus Gracilibacteria bacterium]|nr:hypothetical protein [Candidatus Gracilibacteria bacterium]